MSLIAAVTDRFSIGRPGSEMVNDIESVGERAYLAGGELDQRELIVLVASCIYRHNHLLMARGPADQAHAIRKVCELSLLLRFYIQYPCLIKAADIGDKSQAGSVWRPGRSVSAMDLKILQYVR